jgi:hydroxymethylpyrimidine/phosphomethylpyrimidine kinase
MVGAKVLVISGVDSSGGAGLSRDAQTLTHFGVEACCVVTAITAQTHQALLGMTAVSDAMLQQQPHGALAAGAVAAIKIGALISAEQIVTIAAYLADYASIPIVLDPVLVTSAGGQFLDSTGIAALRTLLIPRVTLLTPNLLEAAALLNTTVADTPAKIQQQATTLLALGSTAVLLKGGHATGAESIDWLVSNSEQPLLCLAGPRLPVSVRGTGCRLSSAIAAGLALQMPLAQACALAHDYVQQRLREAYATCNCVAVET